MYWKQRSRSNDIKHIYYREKNPLLRVFLILKIIDAVTNKENTAVVSKSECPFKRPIKRMKMSGSFNSPLLGNETSEETNLLTMPKPDHSHQVPFS